MLKKKRTVVCLNMKELSDVTWMLGYASVVCEKDPKWKERYEAFKELWARIEYVD